MAVYRIGDVTKMIGLTADTLRYYEKIKLLPKVSRNVSGIREYDVKDISRLKFIKRAQKMNFSLAEISDLLEMRENPQNVRDEVRKLTADKLQEVDDHLQSLNTLRSELQLLLNLCRGTKDGCPIIEELDEED